MKRNIVIGGLMLILFSGMCLIENNAVALRPKEQPDKKTSSVIMIASEFRTVFANLLWIKAEQYNHEYTERNANWTKDKELLGLITLITKLDPHFLEAYAVGTYMYADGCKDNVKAMSYLSEGIANNPKAWELHQIAAIMYVRRMHNPQRALPHAKLALKYCDDKWYLRSMKKLLRTVEELAKESEEREKPSSPIVRRFESAKD